MELVRSPKKFAKIEIYEADRLRLIGLASKNKSYANTLKALLDMVYSQQKAPEEPVQPQPQHQEQPIVDKV